VVVTANPTVMPVLPPWKRSRSLRKGNVPALLPVTCLARKTVTVKPTNIVTKTITVVVMACAPLSLILVLPNMIQFVVAMDKLTATLVSRRWNQFPCLTMENVLAYLQAETLALRIMTVNRESFATWTTIVEVLVHVKLFLLFARPSISQFVDVMDRPIAVHVKLMDSPHPSPLMANVPQHQVVLLVLRTETALRASSVIRITTAAMQVHVILFLICAP